MTHDTPFSTWTSARTAINRVYLHDEAEHLDMLLPFIKLNEREQAQVETLARRLVNKVRSMANSSFNLFIAYA